MHVASHTIRHFPDRDGVGVDQRAVDSLARRVDVLADACRIHLRRLSQLGLHRGYPGPFVWPCSKSSVSLPKKMIVTVTGQGYRFVAPVSEVLKEEPPVLELQTVAESIGPLAKRRNRRAFSLAAVLVIAIVASVIWRLPSRRVPLWSTPVPLTRLSGDEIHPAISPDGQRIAFAWNGGTGTSYSIYVKSSDAEDPQRITNSSGQDGSPVWSPDGKQLTFVRFAGDGSGIYLVPSRGGAERRIVCLSSHQGNIHARDLDWSPDGQTLVFDDSRSGSQILSIYALRLQNGSIRKLTSPPAQYIGDAGPRFSPDGRHVFFIRISSRYLADLYLCDFSGSGLRQMTFDQKEIADQSWSNRLGSELVFSSNRDGTFRLWRLDTNKPKVPPVVVPDTLDARSVAVSRASGSLVFSQAVSDANVWKIDFSRPEAVTLQPVISSIRDDVMPQFCPATGKLLFASNRSGPYEIWRANSDGTGAKRLTNDNGMAGAMAWSPDGQWIAFDLETKSVRNIFIMDVEGRRVRPVTTMYSDVRVRSIFQLMG